MRVTSADGDSKRRMTFQLAKVNNALGSVSQIVRNGNKVVFGVNDSCLENTNTKERMWLNERNGVHVLPFKIAPPGHDPNNSKQGFAGQGR